MFGPYGSKESLLAPLRRFLDKHEAKQQQLAGAAHGLHRRTRLALRTGTAHPRLLARERARVGPLVDRLTTAPVACGEVTLRQHANENGCDSVPPQAPGEALRVHLAEHYSGKGGRVRERLLTADARRGPSLGAALQSLFQFLHVPRCPPLCLPLRDERDEQPADPVTPKVELVRDARPATVVERLDGASVFSSDGAVKAANGEASWRVELRNLDGHVQLAPTYATRHDRARPDRDGAFADPLGADDTALPFGQMRRVRDVREYIFGASRDLDARNDGCHRLPPSGRRNIDDSASGDGALWLRRRPPARDRKSTRLNSSH